MASSAKADIWMFNIAVCYQQHSHSIMTFFSIREPVGHIKISSIMVPKGKILIWRESNEFKVAIVACAEIPGSLFYF